MDDGQPGPIELHRMQRLRRERPGVFHFLAAARGLVLSDPRERELAEAQAGVELAAMTKEERVAIHALAAEWRAQREHSIP
jgi:hypothetical protein